MKKMYVKKLAATALCGAMVFSLAGCGGSSESETTAAATTAAAAEAAPAATEAASNEGKKVAIIYTVTGKGDLSFNDAAYAGAKKAEEDLGVQLVEVEPTSLSDTEQAFEEMSAEGDYELIIGITYEALDAIAKVAPNYPDQKYALVDTDAGQPNAVSYIARENESAFMVGCLAALLQDESLPMLNDQKVVGIVPAMDADVPNRHVTGYTCGVKYINPEVEVLVDYVGSFDDTAAAQAIAQTMNQNGADIVYQVSAAAGLGVFKAAEDMGFMAIGMDDNQNYIDPDTIVASSLKRVDEFVYTAIEDALNGSFKGGQALSMGLAENGVGYTFDQSEIEVPQEVKDTLEEIKEKIISGELQIPNTKDGIDAFAAANHYAE